jgi:hypothetical protein
MTSLSGPANASSIVFSGIPLLEHNSRFLDRVSIRGILQEEPEQFEHPHRVPHHAFDYSDRHAVRVTPLFGSLRIFGNHFLISRSIPGEGEMSLEELQRFILQPTLADKGVSLEEILSYFRDATPREIIAFMNLGYQTRVIQEILPYLVSRLSQPDADPANYILQGDKLYYYAPGGNVQLVTKYGPGNNRFETDAYPYGSNRVPVELNEKAYLYKLKENNKYLCTLSGECELSLHPSAKSLDECLATCEAVPNKDLVYEILQYSPLEALVYADSDQLVVVKRMTGEVIPRYRVNEVLEVLAGNNWSGLSSTPELKPYLRRMYPASEILLRGVANIYNLRFPPSYEYLYSELDKILQEYETTVPDARERFEDEDEDEDEDDTEEAEEIRARASHVLGTRLISLFFTEQNYYDLEDTLEQSLHRLLLEYYNH